MPPLPLPVIAGVYYGRVVGDVAGRPSTNVFAFQKAGVPLGSAGDAANANAVATALAANWPAVPGGAAGLNQAYTGVEATCYPLGSPLLPKESVPMTAAGSDTAELIPITASVCITHSVTRRGRGSQSRSFLSPLSINSVQSDGKNLLTGFQGPMQSQFDTFIAATIADLITASVGTWTYVQVSKVSGGVPTPAAFPITSSFVELELSSQKRRGIR